MRAQGQPERSPLLAPARDQEGGRQRDSPGGERAQESEVESERAVEPFLATVLGQRPECSGRAESHWQVPERSPVST